MPLASRKKCGTRPILAVSYSPMRAPQVSHRRLTSHDGTRIAYQVCGEGPAVVLANGFCTPYHTYRHIYRLYRRGYRVISWDYRGLFRSGSPPDRRSYGFEHQVGDLERVLAIEGVDRALFIGWSMGVELLLEYYRDHPEQFVGFAALAGTSGRPYDTLGDWPPLRVWMPRLMPIGTRIVSAASPLMRLALGGVARWPGPGLITAAARVGVDDLAVRAGIMAPPLDLDVVRDLVLDYGSLDWRAVARTTRFLAVHDASDMLADIDVPTLVVTGTRDWITPPRLARELAGPFRDAELVLLEGATHYAAVEYPEQVNGHLARFTARVGHGPLADRNGISPPRNEQ